MERHIGFTLVAIDHAKSEVDFALDQARRCDDSRVGLLRLQVRLKRVLDELADIEASVRSQAGL